MFCRKVQNEKGYKIISFRSDHVENLKIIPLELSLTSKVYYITFYVLGHLKKMIKYNEKNNILQEMPTTFLNDCSTKKYFWTKAINPSCYILNTVSMRSILNKTPYKSWKWRKPNISYFHTFGCECFILNNEENIEKFDSKPNKAFFLLVIH